MELTCSREITLRTWHSARVAAYNPYRCKAVEASACNSLATDNHFARCNFNLYVARGDNRRIDMR